MPLTPEELERRTYIEGRVNEAALLGAMIDAQAAEDERVEQAQDEVKRLEDQVDEMSIEINDLNDKIDLLEAENIRLLAYG